MPEYRGIDRPKQLLVDGEDAKWFLSALMEKIGIADIQIQNYGGNNELRGFLKQFRLAPEFTERVESLGIIRDAEADPRAAFQSIKSALKGADLPVPRRISESSTARPHTKVFILPEPDSNGMLETLCLSSVEADPAMQCVKEYFGCVKERLGSAPRHIEKAQVQVFLASRDSVPRMLGLGAQQGVWPWESPVFDSIKNFLNTL